VPQAQARRVARALGLGALFACATLAAACSRSSTPKPDPDGAAAAAAAFERDAAADADADAALKLTVAECDSLRSEALRELEAVRSQHLSCVGDAECFFVNDSACTEGLSLAPISRSGEGAHRVAAERVGLSICKRWRDGDCPRTTPQPVGTVAPVAPVCELGRCTTRRPPEPASHDR